MRRFALLAATAVWLLPTAADSQVIEIVACWTEEIVDALGRPQSITRCRLAGGEIIEFRGEWEVPDDLSPNLGSDLVGPCWFLTSRATPYVVVTQFANGDALIGYIPDPNDPGIWIAVEVYRRCTSEPEDESHFEVEVWEYVHSYIHAPPVPELNPAVGQGVTGLATYLGTVVPDLHQASLTGAAATLDVEIRVAGVIVDWGDDTAVEFPPDGRMLAGYPSGAAWHVYQSKGDDLLVAVSYRWAVRWRANGGPWVGLAVPATTTSLAYPVAEIVSVLGD